MNMDHFWAYLRNGVLVTGKNEGASIEPGDTLFLPNRGNALIISFQKIINNKNQFIAWRAWIVPF